MSKLMQVSSVEDAPGAGATMSKTDEYVAELRPVLPFLPVWNAGDPLTNENAAFIPHPQNNRASGRGISRAVNAINDALATAESDARYERLSRIVKDAKGNRVWASAIVRVAGTPAKREK